METSNQVTKRGIYVAMPWVIFLVFMQVFSDKMFGIMTPVIATSFSIDASTVSLLTTVAMLVFGIGGAVYSTLADVLAPRKLFVIGAVCFAAGSLAGLLLQFSFPLVVLARAVQVAGAAVIPGCFIVLVRRYLDEEHQATYLGFNTAMYQLSAGLGSLFGGYVTKYFSWGVTFAIPVIVLATIPVFLKYLPNDEKKDANSKVDVIGIVFISVLFGSMLLAINTKQLMYVAICIVFAVIYAIYALRAENPIIDLRLFTTPKLLSGTLVSCLIYGVQMTFFFLFSFLILGAYNVDVAYVGLMYIPANLCAFVSGMSSGFITKKIGNRRAFFLGCTVIMASLVMFGTMVGQNIIWMWVAMTLFGVGYTIIYPGYYTAFSNAMPEAIIGRAMAVSNLLNRIANALAIALAGAALTSKAIMSNGMPFLADPKVNVYSNICLVLALCVVVAMIAFSLVFKKKEGTANA